MAIGMDRKEEVGLGRIGNSRAFIKGKVLVARARQNNLAAEFGFKIFFQRLGNDQRDVLFRNLMATDRPPVFAAMPGIDDDAIDAQGKLFRQAGERGGGSWLLALALGAGRGGREGWQTAVGSA